MANTPETAAQLYTDAASGQVGTYTLAKLRNFIASMEAKSPLSVLEYGATGNGTTDDTAAIASAIAAAATGQIVTFPPGTYKISSVFSLTAAITIEVQTGATILLANGSNCTMFNLGANGISFKGGGTLDLNGANNATGGSCIQINTGISFCRVSRLELKNYVSAGVAMPGASNNVIEDSYIHSSVGGTSSYGVFMNYSGTTASTNNIVRNNIINTSGDGVWSGGNGTTPPTVFSSNNIISGNQITSHKIGIEIWGGSPYANVVNNNVIALNDLGYGWGISIDRADFSTVTGNVVNAQGTNGIEVAGANNVTCAGNTVFGNTTCAAGFSLSNTGSNCTVSSNIVDSCTKGIYTSLPGTIVTGNIITTATSNGIEFNGGDHQICVGNQVTTTGTGIIFEENSYVACLGNYVNAGSNGVQFVANNGTTRDYITVATNTIIAAVNYFTLTGAYFGTHLNYQYADGSGNYTLASNGNTLSLFPIKQVYIYGTGNAEGSLFTGAVLKLEGGDGTGSASIELKNLAAQYGQLGIGASGLSTYKGVTAGSLFGYSPLHDIALLTDAGVISLATNGGVQAQIVNTASAVNYITLTGGASGSNAVTLNPIGTDTNIGLVLNTKGSGGVIFFGPQVDGVYSKQIPVTGFSIALNAGRTTLVLDPAGTLATGTITMPATPTDGQIVRISTTQTITSLTVSPNTGQSIKNAPSTLAAGGKLSYIYVLANTTWYVN